MTGRQIENYLIQDRLGEGGMGVVYKAVDTNLDRVVAIKVLNAEMARDAEMASRFRSEARAQANLGHPNVATLYNFFIHEGNPFMVMEFVEGENLQNMLERRGPIPVADAIPLFRQALLGMGAAHRMGIVHRDVKPANLMLSRSGLVKVMDFGIAKMAASGTRTRTGMQVGGTAYYMAPEQIRGERVDIRTDIYALGITLYQLLTAHVPFSTGSEYQIYNDHVNTPPPPPSTFYPYLSKELESIVLKAIEKSPDRRFQTVDEFGAALEKPVSTAPDVDAETRQRTAQPNVNPATAPAYFSGAASNVSASSAQPPPATPAPAKRPVPAVKLAAIAAVLVCAAGLAAYLLMKGSPGKTSGAPVTVSQVKAPSSGALLAGNSDESMKSLVKGEETVVPEKSGVDRTGSERVANGSTAPAAPQPSTVSNRRAAPPSHRAARPGAVPAESSGVAPEQQAAPPNQASTNPPVSNEALEDAQHRLGRLQSRASALHANLEDMRRNLAAQGLSVRSEAIEAAGNLDMYLQEADRALQSGDVTKATANMDRADQAAKKVAGVVGG